jgi:hypothetical protein
MSSRTSFNIIEVIRLCNDKSRREGLRCCVCVHPHLPPEPRSSQNLVNQRRHGSEDHLHAGDAFVVSNAALTRQLDTDTKSMKPRMVRMFGGLIIIFDTSEDTSNREGQTSIKAERRDTHGYIASNREGQTAITCRAGETHMGTLHPKERDRQQSHAERRGLHEPRPHGSPPRPP